MPAQRTQPAARAVKTERTHEENQERAYIAASRRSDRSIEARVESARRASDIHKKRTGRALRVTEQDVINEDMYEEEDDDLPRNIRTWTSHLQTSNPDFNSRLADYVITHFGGPEAAVEHIKRAEMDRQEKLRTGQPVSSLDTMSLFANGQNTMGIQQQMARQQAALFGHPMPQQYMNPQTMQPHMMNMGSMQQQPQMHFSSPYGMQNQQQVQHMQHYAAPHQPQAQFNGMSGQMQHIQPMQLTNGPSETTVSIRARRAGSNSAVSVHSIHSNSPLPPAQSPSMLTPQQTRERSVSASAATPIPSIEEQHTPATMPTLSRSTPSSDSDSHQNEYLAQETTAASLLMPEYAYDGNMDPWATETPAQNGGNGFFEPSHFAHSFTSSDPLADMLRMGSQVNPWENDLHNSYSSTQNYAQGKEQVFNGAQQDGSINPGQLDLRGISSYIAGTEQSKVAAANEGQDGGWNDWTEGGDYNSQQVEQQ